MYVLFNTFNVCIESRHRTLKGAYLADRKLQSEVKKHNCNTAYMPTTTRREKEGKFSQLLRLSDQEQNEPEQIAYEVNCK